MAMRVWMGHLCRIHHGKLNFSLIGWKSITYQQFSSTSGNDTKTTIEKMKATSEPIVKEIEDEEELQPHWAAMEKRVIFRKLKPKDGENKAVRGRRLPSAWDHENV